MGKRHDRGIKEKRMANPTTNFGWVMPSATDLVTDLPADFDVFGKAVDTDFVGLKGGTTGQVLAKASGTDLDFVWSADAAGMTNPMTTTADIIYSSSGSTPARLGIGSTDDVLTVAGGVPTWAAPAGGGKVLQAVSTTYSTYQSSASVTYANTGLSLSITPSSVDSKILILISQALSTYRNNTNAGAALRICRGETSIFSPSGGDGSMSTGNASGSQMYIGAYVSYQYLDSPATTSETTYKTQFRVNDITNTGTVYAQSGAPSSIILLEIGG